MKFALVAGLTSLATSAMAFDLVWYTGQECTGQRVWDFTIDSSNRNECHQVDSTATSLPSMTMSQTDGEGEDDYVVLYSGDDCDGDLVGRGQDGCVTFEGASVGSFQFVTFSKVKKVF